MIIKIHYEFNLSMEQGSQYIARALDDKGNHLFSGYGPTYAEARRSIMANLINIPPPDENVDSKTGAVIVPCCGTFNENI